MKKLRIKILYLITAGAFLAPAFFIPAASSIAAVGVTGPTSMVTTQTILPAASGELALFQMNLSQDAGETLSSISVIVNHYGTTNVAASHLASLSVYKDNGDGLFNPANDLLASSTNSINLDATTTISLAANNTLNGGKFFVSLKTSALWTDAASGDSITVTFPVNGLVTSANTPSITPVTTATIVADTTGPSLVSAVAQNTGGTAVKEAGDSVLLTFSEPTNKPTINSSNIAGIFSLSGSRSFLDGAGFLGATAWNVSGTALTITLSAATSLPTVAVGDTAFITLPSVITDSVGNKASGSSLISGTFGGSISVVGPNSLITSPTLIGASSAPLGLFEVSLNQTSGEKLSSISVTVNKNNVNNVTGSDLASLAVYKDNGNGTFNSVSDLLAGSQSTVNISSPTTINTASNNTLDGGKFFVALSTAASWSGNSPADSITVTFPAIGIVLSVNSPTVSALTTNTISAPSNNVSVTTNAATNITSSSATLNGTNGSTAADDTSFWTGKTAAGPFTPAADPTSELPSGWTGVDSGAQAANAAFSYPMAGLTANTQYYFVAWSHVSGIWYPGAVLNFTTANTVTTGTGTISGMTYNDLNKNEAKDSGEPGIAGFTINLYKGAGWWGPAGNNAPLASAVTDANGNYSFSNLAEGTYSVEEINLPAWHQDTSDYYSIVISNGAAITNIDFANTSNNGSHGDNNINQKIYKDFFGSGREFGQNNALSHGIGNKFGLLKHGLLNGNSWGSDNNGKGHKN